MSRATRRSMGRRESRRRFEKDLRKILRLERDGHSVPAIASSTRLPTSFVEYVIEDFRRFQEARKEDRCVESNATR